MEVVPCSYDELCEDCGVDEVGNVSALVGVCRPLAVLSEGDALVKTVKGPLKLILLVHKLRNVKIKMK